ncbi:MAG: N-6 DNA methylase, partial [Bacteroidia bacterium]|nr:N-6 DNA methylase [Bacteroidia bacterium]
MPLFQASVLKKYLSQQDTTKITTAYAEYSSYFHNSTIQENIRNSKEEQFQEGFLRELFVTILGYTLNPTPNFNLTTEYKNVKDSKKADGAILVNDKVSAVIELKGTNTTDLGKIEAQAFGYKNNQPECVYVITSNFEKLRFYIDNAIEHIEFNLFSLSEKEFQQLYLCLSYDNLSQNIAKKIKDESVSVEDVITKKLYKDYSLFKRELHQNLVQLNPEFEPLELFKKSQKLLDRFLFLFFGEDRHLLPPNSVRLILNQWNQLKDLDEYSPLYDRFKKYFGYLNTGYKGTQHDVFAYNGGLFKPDTILDTIKIDDNLLYSHTLKLSEYDFASEVDVNILGHIFENSLNELDEIKAQLEGAEIDKTKTKRKKDGVFYTPKYITKYIVENTVGKLCNEKKTELGIADEDYTADKKRQKKTVQTLVEKLEEYRKWLLQLTICDPACGSGAFLNQALDFLITEHQYIDELQAKLFGDGLVLSDMENSILENNLFGVDLNEESVEIAKLSLWLRTAQPNRKLNDLNSNIKCGNSLIDDPEVADDKAFNWQQAFPKVFEKGGFDVIIGNPPYVPTEYIAEIDKTYLEKNYQSAFGRMNLYPIFYEKGIQVLRKNGVLGFITPYTILKNQYYKEARKFIIDNTKILELIDFKGILVFQDAAVDSIILILEKEIKDKYEFKQISNIVSFENQLYNSDNFDIIEIKQNEDLSMLVSNNDKLIKRVSKNTRPLKEILNFNQGIITGGNSKYITKEKSELTEKVITGSDFNRYLLNNSNQYIIYDIKELHRPRKREIFEAKEKILLRQTGSYPICTIDYEQFFTLDTVHNGLLINQDYSLKYLLVLMNSRLLRFLYESQINEGGKVFAQVKIIYIDPLPIQVLSKSKQIP